VPSTGAVKIGALSVCGPPQVCADENTSAFSMALTTLPAPIAEMKFGDDPVNVTSPVIAPKFSVIRGANSSSRAKRISAIEHT